MYVPDAFRIEEKTELHRLIESHPLALVIHGDGEALDASPVPVVLDAAVGPLGRLRFHLSRANPLADRLREGPPILLHFSGPGAYVSPDWYATEGLPPTWNYVAVQARGIPRTIESEALRRLLVDLGAVHEAPLPKAPWQIGKMDPVVVDRMQAAIVGFEVPIQRLEGKAKLSQNRSAADRDGVARALASLDDPNARAIAGAMG